MGREHYRYTIAAHVPLDDVKESLMLAVLATESLEGRSEVRLNASFCVKNEDRVCVIDSSSEVGRKIAAIFTGFLTREFGEDAFSVARVSRPETRAEAKEDVDAAN